MRIFSHGLNQKDWRHGHTSDGQLYVVVPVFGKPVPDEGPFEAMLREQPEDFWSVGPEIVHERLEVGVQERVGNTYGQVVLQ